MSWTHRPPLRCNNDPEMDARHANDVMKIPRTADEMDDPDILHDFQAELEMSARIRSLDPEQKYFLPLSADSCELDPVVVEEQFGDDSPPRTGYFIPYGGVALTQALRTATPEDVWNWFRHLLEAVKVLEDHTISQGDLHSGNIVVDPVGWLPRIIDFGGAIDLEEEMMEDEGSFDVYRLALNYSIDAIPLLRRRFPSSERLDQLQQIVNRILQETPTPLARDVLTLLD